MRKRIRFGWRKLKFESFKFESENNPNDILAISGFAKFSWVRITVLEKTRISIFDYRKFLYIFQ